MDDTWTETRHDRVAVLTFRASPEEQRAVMEGLRMPLEDGLRLEGDLNHQLAATEDRAEGIAAFFAKRPPDFSGR